MYKINIVFLGKKSGKYGEFQARAAFDITHESIPSDEISGIVIQHIQKNTIVEIFGGKQLTTSEEISAFTSNKVKYMNDSYLEYFQVRKGKSVEGDEFANGPIVPYEGAKMLKAIVPVPPYDPSDLPYTTKGRIYQIGTAIFIPSENAKLVQKTYNWSTAKSLPSNGLPYLSEQYKDEIFARAESNIVKHIVRVDWDNLDSQSIILDSAEDQADFQGGRRRKRKTRRRQKNSK